MAEHMQIGEVAERTGLSLRTIRYYGEMELVAPSSRTDGGFRLYTDSDVEKLELIKKMKPLDFSLEEMREMLAILAEVPAADDAGRAQQAARLAEFRSAAEERRVRLAAKLAAAESFIAQLDTAL